MKHDKLGDAMLNKKPSNGSIKSIYKVICITEKQRSHTYDIIPTFRTSKYLSLMALIDLN